MAATVTYTAKFDNGETLRFRADLADNASPIELEDCDGNWTSTGFQTADAGHDAHAAAAMLADDDNAEIVELTIEQHLARDWKLSRASNVSAKDWYESFGWHITTDAGDYSLQYVDFADVRGIDDVESPEAERLIDETLEVIEGTRDDATALVEKAIEVADAAREIKRRRDEIVAAAKAADLELVVKLLDELSWYERQFGDDPIAESLRVDLIVDAREI